MVLPDTFQVMRVLRKFAGSNSSATSQSWTMSRLKIERRCRRCRKGAGHNESEKMIQRRLGVAILSILSRSLSHHSDSPHFQKDSTSPPSWRGRYLERDYKLTYRILFKEWQQEIGAFAIFLSWMGLLLFIQKIPRLGIFVVMFTDILKTFGQFFIVFAFFIFGFSLSFTILLGNQVSILQYVLFFWFIDYEKSMTIKILRDVGLSYASICTVQLWNFKSKNLIFDLAVAARTHVFNNVQV